MGAGTNRDMISKKRKSLQSSSDFPKLNLQSGSKEKELFVVKLLPALKVVDGKMKILSDKEPWFEHYMHYGCGPDGDQHFPCLNVTVEERKKNAKKCAQCSALRKILRNPDEHKESEVAIAKKKAAKGQVFWPVYDLDKRKIVEIMSITRGAYEDILDEFGEDEDYIDLTDLRGDGALQILRKNSGRDSEYKRKAVFGKNYILSNEDLKNIRDSYLDPVPLVKFIDAEAIEAIAIGDVEFARPDVDEERGRSRSRTAHPDDSEVVLDDGDAEAKPTTRRRESVKEEKAPVEEAPRTRRQRAADQDDDLLDDGKAPANEPPATSSRSRTRTETPAAEKDTSNDDLLAQLDAI